VLGPDGVKNNSPSAQTSFCPDPSGPALLGASTRGGRGIPNTKQPKTETRIPKKQGHAMACPCCIWSSVLVFGIPDFPVLAGRAAQVARSAAEGPRLRVAFLLGTFLWRSKEKCLARRGETRPAGPSQESARRSKDRRSIPGFLPSSVTAFPRPSNKPKPPNPHLLLFSVNFSRKQPLKSCDNW